jgi:hypothetical protein
MDPATSLKACCQSSCQSPNNCVLIWVIRLKASLAVFVKFQADFLACELFEICSPLRPEIRALYRIFSNLDRYRTQYNERLPLELTRVQRRKKFLVKFGIRIAQRAE